MGGQLGRVVIFSRLYKVYSMLYVNEKRQNMITAPDVSHLYKKLVYGLRTKPKTSNSFFVRRTCYMGSKGVSKELETYAALGLDESDKGSSETPRVLSLLGSILEGIIVEQHRYGPARKDIITMFHCSSAPNLSITKYLERISKYSKCSSSCFVLAFIYIERFLRRNNDRLTPLNVHRLVITSVMVAAKFWDDECYNNAYYARVGGVSTAEMNRMEMKLLFDLDFKLRVTNQVFRNYCLKLEEQSARSDYNSTTG